MNDATQDETETAPFLSDLDLHNFSLVRGGPAYRLLRTAGLTPSGLRGAIILSLALITICLLPLVVMTAIDGTLVRTVTGVPLIRDAAALSRFLVALPALILIAPDCDKLLRLTLVHFIEAGLVQRKDLSAFTEILHDTMRLRDSTMPEFVLFALAFVPVLLTLDHASLLPPLPGWRLAADGMLSMAGIWFEFFAKPIWLFIALLWVWRLAMWTWMLWRICRLDLALHAAHPDGVGGLGFIPLIQQRFSKFSFAGGVIFAGAATNEIIYRQMPLHDVGWALAAYVAGAIVLLCLPLLMLSPRLVSLKRHGLLAYGTLGSAYMDAFSERWLQGAATTAIPVEAAEASAFQELGGQYGTLSDLNAAYRIIEQIPIIPVNRWVLIGIALPSVLPMVPVAIVAFGLDDAVKKLIEMLT